MNENMARTTESAQITNKGWTVCKKRSKKYSLTLPYLARASNNAKGIMVNIGYFATREDAARHAVAAAHTHGTLDWAKTMLWFKLKGYSISFDDVFSHKKISAQKGWYTSKNKTSAGTVFYQFLIGPSHSESKYAMSASTVEKTIVLGLPLAKKKPYYNEHSTIRWLKRNNLEHLIEAAKIV